MARVHEVLHWANRRAVAEEVTRRGYRLSGETLNRWVRDEKEFPAMVERIVFELFGISETTQKEPPWVGRLEGKLDQLSEQRAEVVDDAIKRLVASLAPPERVADVEALAAELRRVPPPSGEEPPETPASEDRDTSEPAGQGSA